jgi:hypothetical protein
MFPTHLLHELTQLAATLRQLLQQAAQEMSCIQRLSLIAPQAAGDAVQHQACLRLCLLLSMQQHNRYAVTDTAQNFSSLCTEVLLLLLAGPLVLQAAASCCCWQCCSAIHKRCNDATI